MFQLSLLSPDFMQHHSATSKTAISTSGKTTPSCGNNQAQSQLYQKTQLRKLVNFSSQNFSTQSIRNTLISFLGKQWQRKWKVGILTWKILEFSVTATFVEKICCSNTSPILKVDYLVAMWFSKISAEHIIGNRILSNLTPGQSDIKCALRISNYQFQYKKGPERGFN